ncbi:hypothetical protein BDK51DRAFT_50864 [Blyttiomyces helicus]|uniref:Uncharacterized protein n=1 Tax=Blyttiomyces helicus TaxID=388810 RepID=A0A4P9WD29_9FUNG|nr:hypothetical protein BDK51DRAFT_50864 [Blyttiomyces helicus]|eukprot:RKO89595.1 hypothetical protein BDK51DRAFT_50864 [Blyttiomyces helicus]
MDTYHECLNMGFIKRDIFYHLSKESVHFWNINRYHFQFAFLRTRTFLLRRISHPRNPARILAANLDGSIKLLSPVSGAVLVTAFPVIKDAATVDVAYDIEAERVYSFTTTGDIVMYDSRVNPMKILDVFVHGPNRERLSCIASIDMWNYVPGLNVEADERAPIGTFRRRFYLLAGSDSGQIIHVDSSGGGKQEALVQGGFDVATGARKGICLIYRITQAHSAELTIIKADISNLLLLSGGKALCLPADPRRPQPSDHLIKVWAIQTVDRMVRPKGRAIPPFAVECRAVLSISDVGGGVAGPAMAIGPCIRKIAFPVNGGIMVYSYDMDAQLKPLPIEEEHIGVVTSVAFLSTFQIWASATLDGTVKIWSADNGLLREIQFNEHVSSVSFANNSGDLLIALTEQISVVRIQDYMPLTLLKQAESLKFIDDVNEMPLKFDSNLDFWEYYYEWEVAAKGLGAVSSWHVPKESKRHEPTTSVAKFVDMRTDIERLAASQKRPISSPPPSSATKKYDLQKRANRRTHLESEHRIFLKNKAGKNIQIAALDAKPGLDSQEKMDKEDGYQLRKAASDLVILRASADDLDLELMRADSPTAAVIAQDEPFVESTIILVPKGEGPHSPEIVQTSSAEMERKALLEYLRPPQRPNRRLPKEEASVRRAQVRQQLQRQGMPMPNSAIAGEIDAERIARGKASMRSTRISVVVPPPPRPTGRPAPAFAVFFPRNQSTTSNGTIPPAALFRAARPAQPPKPPAAPEPIMVFDFGDDDDVVDQEYQATEAAEVEVPQKIISAEFPPARDCETPAGSPPSDEERPKKKSRSKKISPKPERQASLKPEIVHRSGFPVKLKKPPVPSLHSSLREPALVAPAISPQPPKRTRKATNTEMRPLLPHVITFPAAVTVPDEAGVEGAPPSAWTTAVPTLSFSARLATLENPIRADVEEPWIMEDDLEGGDVYGIVSDVVYQNAESCAWKLLSAKKFDMRDIPPELGRIMNKFWVPEVHGRDPTLIKIAKFLVSLLRNDVWAERCEASNGLLFLYHTFRLDFADPLELLIRPQLDVLHSDQTWQVCTEIDPQRRLSNLIRQVRAQLCTNILAYGVIHPDILFTLICLLPDDREPVAYTVKQGLAQYGITCRDNLRMAMVQVGLIPRTRNFSVGDVSKLEVGPVLLPQYFRCNIIADLDQRSREDQADRFDAIRRWLRGMDARLFEKLHRVDSYFEHLAGSFFPPDGPAPYPAKPSLRSPEAKSRSASHEGSFPASRPRTRTPSVRSYMSTSKQPLIKSAKMLVEGCRLQPVDEIPSIREDEWAHIRSVGSSFFGGSGVRGWDTWSEGHIPTHDSKASVIDGGGKAGEADGRRLRRPQSAPNIRRGRQNANGGKDEYPSRGLVTMATAVASLRPMSAGLRPATASSRCSSAKKRPASAKQKASTPLLPS